MKSSTKDKVTFFSALKGILISSRCISACRSAQMHAKHPGRARS